MEREKPRSRKKKSSGLKPFAIAGGALVAAAALIAGVSYYQIGKHYERVFLPNTTINGVDASKKSVEEVREVIASGINGYTLAVLERGGREETIKGTDIGLEAVFDGSLENLLAGQEAFQWISASKEPKSYEIDTMIQYDEAKLEDAFLKLSCFNEELMEKPENAYLSDYVSGQGYTVIVPKEGSFLDPLRAKEGITEAIMYRKPSVSLEELEAYIRPEVLADDPGLLEQLETKNRYAGVTITYDFGTEKQVLNGDTISQWIGTGDQGEIALDSQAIGDYVKELASRYDTYNRAKTLKTSYGQTIKITGGVYGWRIDPSAEAAQLAELIRTGQSQEREPVYRQKAASRTGADYGNTYVEINLTGQHLFFYKDGKLVVESDFVSGNAARGWATPAGVYSLTYKQRNAVLKGENYRTPVDYWMPFNGGIGLHDAKWRSTFGGEIYKTGGSHGCVNLPHSVAKTIYENIEAGIPVLCYHLDGTGSSGAKSAPKTGETRPSKPAAQTPAAPAETTPAPEETKTQTQPENPVPEGPQQPSETAPKEPEQPQTETRPGEPAAAPTQPQTGPGESKAVGPGVPGSGATKEEVGPGVNE